MINFSIFFQLFLHFRLDRFNRRVKEIPLLQPTYFFKEKKILNRISKIFKIFSSDIKFSKRTILKMSEISKTLANPKRKNPSTSIQIKYHATILECKKKSTKILKNDKFLDFSPFFTFPTASLQYESQGNFCSTTNIFFQRKKNIKSNFENFYESFLPHEQVFKSQNIKNIANFHRKAWISCSCCPK